MKRFIVVEIDKITALFKVVCVASTEFLLAFFS